MLSLPISLWSQYDVILEGTSEINDSAGGWHRGFDALTTPYHHSLWEVIENFRTIIDWGNGRTGLFGGPLIEKKRRVITGEKRLVSVVLQNEEKNEGDDSEDYLEGLARNLNYWLCLIYFKPFSLYAFFPSSMIIFCTKTHFTMTEYYYQCHESNSASISHFFSKFRLFRRPICHSTRVHRRPTRFRPIWLRLECVDQIAFDLLDLIA